MSVVACLVSGQIKIHSMLGSVVARHTHFSVALVSLSCSNC